MKLLPTSSPVYEPAGANAFLLDIVLQPFFLFLILCFESFHDGLDMDSPLHVEPWHED
jgi:hypothetical protein